MRPQDLVDIEVSRGNSDWPAGEEPLERLLRRASGMGEPESRRGVLKGPFCVVCLDVAHDIRTMDRMQVALCEAHYEAESFEVLWAYWYMVVALGLAQRWRKPV